MSNNTFFKIQLPPEAERLEIARAWVDSVLSANQNYDDFFEIVGKIIDAGYSNHGISCFIMHDTTQRFIRNRINMERKSDWLIPILESPICLN